MPEPAIVDLGDFVRVINLESHDLIWSWNSRRYAISSGKEAIVPFDAAKLYLGDPRSTDKVRSLKNEQGLVQFLPDRLTEVRRLKILYGGLRMADETVIDGAPDVEVYTMEGQRITTVLDDPSGSTVTASIQTVQDTDTLLARMARQDRLIEQLMGKLQMKPEDLSPVDELVKDETILDELPPEDV